MNETTGVTVEVDETLAARFEEVIRAAVTPPAPEVPTFKIRDGYLGDLEARFAVLAKRAAKLGVPAPTFTVTGTEDKPETKWSDATGAWEPTGVVHRWYTVTVQGDAPKYGGWSLLAVIDRDLEEKNAPNVVHLLPGVELDDTWRTLGDVCDHCAAQDGHQIARGRKKLVVVAHDTDGRRVVGTTCLHDFLGHGSPERIASWVETLSSLADLFASFGDDDESGGFGGGFEARFDPVAFLARTIKVVRESGWVSRGHAYDFGGKSTADQVVDEITWRPSKHEPYPPTDPTGADTVTAEAALAWAVDVDTHNDYLANVQAVATKSGWRAKDIGFGASIATAYQRDQDKAREQARQAAVPPTVPCPSGKAVITGEVIALATKEAFNGGTRLVQTVLDDRGFKVWGTVPAAIDMVERGARVTFTATVEAKDATFGFYKRPTAASILDAGPEAVAQ